MQLAKPAMLRKVLHCKPHFPLYICYCATSSIQSQVKCAFNSSRLSCLFNSSDTKWADYLSLITGRSFSLQLLFLPLFLLNPFCERSAGERRHKHTNLLLKPLLQAYLQVLSGHSCSPLYATPGLRIRKDCLSDLSHWELIAAECVINASHSSNVTAEPKELCLVFAQLCHLHVTTERVRPAKCPIKKSLRLCWRIFQRFCSFLATWANSQHTLDPGGAED